MTAAPNPPRRTRLANSGLDSRVAYGYEADGGRTVAVLRLGAPRVEMAAAETVAASGILAWASFRYVMLPAETAGGVLSEVLSAARPAGLGILLGGRVRLESEERATDWYTVSLLAPQDERLAGILAERADLFGRPILSAVATPPPIAVEAPASPGENLLATGDTHGESDGDPGEEPRAVSLAEMLGSPEAPPSSTPRAEPPIAVLSREGRNHAVVRTGDGYVLREQGGERPVSLEELAAASAAGDLNLVGAAGDELEAEMAGLPSAEGEAGIGIEAGTEDAEDLDSRVSRVVAEARESGAYFAVGDPEPEEEGEDEPVVEDFDFSDLPEVPVPSPQPRPAEVPAGEDAFEDWFDGKAVPGTGIEAAEPTSDDDLDDGDFAWEGER